MDYRACKNLECTTYLVCREYLAQNILRTQVIVVSVVCANHISYILFTQNNILKEEKSFFFGTLGCVSVSCSVRKATQLTTKATMNHCKVKTITITNTWSVVVTSHFHSRFFLMELRLQCLDFYSVVLCFYVWTGSSFSDWASQYHIYR